MKGKEKSDIELNDEEIDLIELFRFVWSKRSSIFKLAGVFLFLGLTVAFTAPIEYKTSATLIPETAGESSQMAGSLGGLASLAGVDLSNLAGASQAINPALYQSVSRSTPFLMELLDQEFHFSKLDDTLKLKSYFEKHYVSSLITKLISIPGVIIRGMFGDSKEERSAESKDGVIKLTKQEEEIIENLKSRIFVEMDWDLNVVKIQVEMQDPLVAAEMVQYTQNYITSYATNYAISKSKQQLASVEKQYQERKREFEQAQSKLAGFRDKNRNVIKAGARSEEDRLEAEYNLAFNIYNQLAQQREAIKLQIDENTPVFTVLEPVRVPVEKSGPQRLLIILLFLFFGLVVGNVYIFMKRAIYG